MVLFCCLGVGFERHTSTLGGPARLSQLREADVFNKVGKAIALPDFGGSTALSLFYVERITLKTLDNWLLPSSAKCCTYGVL